jgi:hypothetical protein
VREYDQKRYQRAYEKFRDSIAPDNISPDAFSTRINMFTVQVNPFLKHTLAGEDLGAFVIDQLPSTVAPDARILKRTLKASVDVGRTLADETFVIDECLKLIEDAFDAKKPASKVFSASWFIGVAGADKRAAAGADAAAADVGVTAKDLGKVVAAAVKKEIAAAANKGEPGPRWGCRKLRRASTWTTRAPSNWRAIASRATARGTSIGATSKCASSSTPARSPSSTLTPRRTAPTCSRSRSRSTPTPSTACARSTRAQASRP